VTEPALTYCTTGDPCDLGALDRSLAALLLDLPDHDEDWLWFHYVDANWTSYGPRLLEMTA